MPETLPSASVSEKVSQVNEERKKYYAEVARTYGKNESYINRLEYRKNFEPSISVISDIAEACGSSLEEMFYYDINQYSKDKEIISTLKKCNEKKKQAIIDLLNS